MADMDWSEMEDLFCQQVPPSAQSSPKLSSNRDGPVENVERRMRKESTEVCTPRIILPRLIFLFPDNPVRWQKKPKRQHFFKTI